MPNAARAALPLMVVASVVAWGVDAWAQSSQNPQTTQRSDCGGPGQPRCKMTNLPAVPYKRPGGLQNWKPANDIKTEQGAIAKP